MQPVKNMYQSITIILLFSMLTCACSRPGEDMLYGTTVPLSLTATRTGAVTKASDSVLPTGITAGIYVTAKDASVTAAYYSNQKCTSGALGILTPDQPVDITIGSSYDIYVYAPFQSTVTNLSSIPVTNGTDVLWAPKSTLEGVTLSNNTAALAFEHRTAQISFHVGFAAGFTAGSKIITPASTLKVSGFYAGGTFNALTGVIIPAEPANVSINSAGTGTPGTMTLNIVERSFIPAPGNTTLAVTISHDGSLYNGVITDTFSAGNSYHYTITVEGIGATLGITGVLQDWIPVSENITIQ